MTLERNPRKLFWLIVGGAGLLTLGLVMWLRSGLSPSQGGLPAGQKAPEIKAQGWLNGEAPSSTVPEGHVRVVHAWFPECIYCFRDAPELVRLHEKYSDRGVEFLGLTHHGAQKLPAIQQFLQETGITWPNGYGALPTLQQFDVEYFPSAWVINADNKIVWSQDSPGELEDGIEHALDEQS